MLLRGRGPTNAERWCSSSPVHVTRVYAGGEPAVSEIDTGGACQALAVATPTCHTCHFKLQPLGSARLSGTLTAPSRAGPATHQLDAFQVWVGRARGACRGRHTPAGRVQSRGRACRAAARSSSSAVFHCRRCSCQAPRRPERAVGISRSHQVLPRAACALCAAVNSVHSYFHSTQKGACTARTRWYSSDAKHTSASLAAACAAPLRRSAADANARALPQQAGSRKRPLGAAVPAACRAAQASGASAAGAERSCTGQPHRNCVAQSDASCAPARRR
jgi:hypothetical protein